MGDVDMNRLISALLFAALLMLAPVQRTETHAQPVFFSMLFPQLTPGFEWLEATPGEAVFL